MPTMEQVNFAEVDTRACLYCKHAKIKENVGCTLVQDIDIDYDSAGDFVCDLYKPIGGDKYAK